MPGKSDIGFLIATLIFIIDRVKQSPPGLPNNTTVFF